MRIKEFGGTPPLDALAHRQSPRATQRHRTNRCGTNVSAALLLE